METRVEKKYMASYNDNGCEELALTKNLSKSGICISSTGKVPTNKEVLISIAVPGEIFNMKGEVMWCKTSDTKSDSIPDNIGIKITEAPPEYMNFVEYLKHQDISTGKPGL